MPISDDVFKLHPCIFMYDDETVLDAIAVYRDTPRSAVFWKLVVESDGKYAVTTFIEINNLVKDGQKEFLGKPLSSLVGTTLTVIDVVAEQSTSDYDGELSKARTTTSQMVAVFSDGEFKGLLFGGTKRDAGLFGSDLVKLAGTYADLPSSGLVSRRRQEAMAAKKKKTE